ncbi:hypothetical protein PHISCL_04976 [Aspergillus sclerotialis]|uniref:Aminodeoxychorismate lyase n=1 Tax=Aspergillus sclerotialis TaxID=2070753 RepID=A0A3A2ZK39_9EURO|nr:hypothetical protein PHISCL_04976 [Aspergillus sclerotialis]
MTSNDSLSSELFQIISSLRYDPALPGLLSQDAPEISAGFHTSPYYLLPYHQNRLLNAARHFRWEKAVEFLSQDLNTLVQIFDTFLPVKTKPWRLRIVIDRNGTCNVEANPTTPIELLNFLPFQAPSHLNVWRVYVDSVSTVPSAFTTHKTTARDNYTAARVRAGILSPQELAEVLVINPEGQVMEGSITTPYFRPRTSQGQSVEDLDKDIGAKWITPPLSCGGNAGTTRQYALDHGLCTEQVITATELVDGEECWLSNGVRGFVRGVVILNNGKHARHS